MTALRIYRDDGPLASWVGRVLGRDRPPRERAYALEWLVPPLVRLVEYGLLATLTAAADPDALPLCFAFLGVLAFHHYDTVYRLRHQRLAPPSWVRLAGAGWEGRLLIASILALTGGIRFGLLAAAVGLGLLYVTESTSSWLRFSRSQGAALHEDADMEGN
jgi:hypothetical protein